MMDPFTPDTLPAPQATEPAKPVATKATGSRALARSEPKVAGARAGAAAEVRTEVRVPAGLVTPAGGLPPIPAKRYFTIGEVSELCGVKPYVLRYWEQEFSQLRPMKRRGNRRYYQHHEVLLIRRIRELLYEQGFTISGARNQLADHPMPSVALDDEADVPGTMVGSVVPASGVAEPLRPWPVIDLSALNSARPEQVAVLREALLSIRELLA
jgi:DNA-binding transcriptional MerR regulator